MLKILCIYLYNIYSFLFNFRGKRSKVAELKVKLRKIRSNNYTIQKQNYFFHCIIPYFLY